MPNKMLIDASHPEETRIVALRGNRVEDFDFEAASKKPLRGNIYLAKVTRVEPSLQAAFIEYGGNRHGFLAFSEIHPDYYQIPVADRQALLEEEARAHREEDDDHRHGGGSNSQGNNGHGSGGNGRRSRRNRGGRNGQQSEKRADLGDETLSEPIEAIEVEERAGSMAGSDEPSSDAPFLLAESTEASVDGEEPTLPFADQDDRDTGEAAEADDERSAALEGSAETSDFEASPGLFSIESNHDEPDADEASASSFEDDAPRVDLGEEAEARSELDEGFDGSAPRESAQGEDEDEPVEQLGGDAMEDASYRTPRLRRHYKIQEVIKRRQILLVQVVKEERGNKGAALTTYLSLAGRYSVLMPNTARGGGISRKITDADDRRRLKAIAQVLEVPEGMGIILRTAGAARGETEVKRDFEYLLRMWETVRELTLSSSAPKLVYEEGSLIKRAIRDLYSKEVDEVWVSGEAGYREAKDYMRLLMPGHAKNVHLYADPQPIFASSGAEAQLDAMFSNHVTLKSGGYLVINQTEALVAIDVNSGRSTREHNIEDTALRTNLEAADEVARQLRLRDLAGLIVVDFIDMEEGRNNRAVERRIKDALKNDRARIQIGRISHFGLLEMSRQRIRTGVLEGSTVICSHCAGAGTVRSTSSIALHVLRVLEDTLIRSASHNLVVRTRMEVALYILNQKRANLSDLEQRFGVTIVVLADAALTGTVYHAIERGELATPPVILGGRAAVIEQEEEDDLEGPDAEGDEEADEEPIGAEQREAGDQRPRAEGEEQGGRRRRRRRRRGRDRDTREPGGLPQAGEASEEPGDEADELAADAAAPADFVPDDGPRDAPEVTAEAGDEAGEDGAREEAPAEPRRRPRRTRRSSARSTSGAAAGGDEAPEADLEPAAEEEPVAAPRRSRRSRSRAAEEEAPSLLAFEAPSADRDVGADTVLNHPGDVPPASVFEPVQELAVPETVASVEQSAAPVLEEPSDTDTAVAAAPPANDEPARPKRSGWWQRAKATLTGE